MSLSTTRPSTSKPRGVCRYYTHSRGCFAADKCKFLHGEPPIETKPDDPPLLTPYDKAKRCHFYAQGFCKRGDACWFLHVSDHKTNHNTTLSEDQDEELCSICFEKPVMFGLLGGCSHIFCITCIKQWRDPKNKPGGVIESGNTKKCPMCRASTNFITPSSKFWKVGTKEKDEIIKAYKGSMSRVPCCWFQKSLQKNKDKPFCRYGKDCFYQHINTDGTPHIFKEGVDATMPKSRRRGGPMNDSFNIMSLSLDFADFLLPVDRSARFTIRERPILAAQSNAADAQPTQLNHRRRDSDRRRVSGLRRLQQVGEALERLNVVISEDANPEDGGRRDEMTSERVDEANDEMADREEDERLERLEVLTQMWASIQVMRMNGQEEESGQDGAETPPPALESLGRNGGPSGDVAFDMSSLPIRPWAVDDGYESVDSMPALQSVSNSSDSASSDEDNDEDPGPSGRLGDRTLLAAAYAAERIQSIEQVSGSQGHRRVVERVEMDEVDSESDTPATEEQRSEPPFVTDGRGRVVWTSPAEEDKSGRPTEEEPASRSEVATGSGGLLVTSCTRVQNPICINYNNNHPSLFHTTMANALKPLFMPASSTTYSAPKTPADEGIEFFQAEIHPGESPICVYELRLDPDGGPSKDLSYIRLPPAYVPYILRVSLQAGTPASKNGVFKTNFPLDGGSFGREKYTQRKLPQDFSKPVQVDLPISQAGAFVYWIEYDDGNGGKITGRSGYFNIDPILKTKARTAILDENLQVLPPNKGGSIIDEFVNLPLDGLSVLTVVSKWMGSVESWTKHIAEAKDRGYTMLHYTPLQERGESDSPYSIRNQMKYDSSLFGTNLSDIEGRKRMDSILKIAREEYGLLSLTDVVLNHTANNSPWLTEHPEAGFSPANSPHLTPALELDRSMVQFSSSLLSNGLPSIVTSEDDINSLVNAFENVTRELNLWQYYVLDSTRERKSIMDALQSGKITPWSGPNLQNKTVEDLAGVLRNANKINGLGRLASRFSVAVDGPVSAGFTRAAFPDIRDQDGLADTWVKIVDVLNVPLYREWEEDAKAAIANIRNRLKYARLDIHGPRLGEISEANPLVEPYFTLLAPTANADPLVYSLANNGWIWDADPLQNFALLPSKAYLRREVIVWGDCVKLRYGLKPSDNPWLWSHMTSYVTSLAETFEGFRIDNCHSTPLEVGTRMLDAARVVRPDLYVCAELFTGNEDMDLIFVRELGINSLIRESGNGWDPKELSRLLYRHGLGKPIGSMDGACMVSREDLPSPTGRGPIRTALVTPLNGSQPHALLYDLTHDNETPLDKRSAEDALSTGALAAFSYCAVGSVKGFDDLYPKLLDLVRETRQYEVTGLEDSSGIAKIKRVLNNLHLEMVLNGFQEGHVHQENDYIVLHRVQPTSQKGYLLVAHTAFSKGSKDRGNIDPIKLRRTRAKFILGASIEISSYEISDDPKFLRGLPSKLVQMSSVVVPQGLDHEGPYAEIIVPENFPPGSIMLFETQLQQHDSSLDAFCVSGALEAFSELDLVDLNVVLHRTDVEERDATDGEFGAYDVSGLGKMVYCGLEGWMHPLRHIMRYNDLGHPLCAHLREGSWAFDYVHNRLNRQIGTFPKLAKPAEWLKERFDRVKSSVPNYMRPKYFALVISGAYKAARKSAMEQCSDFVVSGHSFIQDLALCSVQMYGMVKSASLDPRVTTPSLSAGLPHFTTGWARCWGRDVFISLSGLFLTTGNYGAARKHILAFASTLKHGLIPNLLDSGRNPRYNSRDSPWWMLQSIQEYVRAAPDGHQLLSETIKRRFPKDETWVAWDDTRAYAHSSSLAEIIQEILQRHVDGIHFREHNAGPDLDMQMKNEGFNIDIRVDWETGFIFGGNQNNCGTWMDKMGESTKAGTKGVPGTPRDGAPIEIIGLLKSTLRWLSELSSKGKFPFKGVQAEGRLVSYQEWSDLIQASFEKCYHVPFDSKDDEKYKVDSKLVNRRGIYKDVYGSGAGHEWADYQFRCNFPIAMAVAPEMFNEKHAFGALRLADQVLRGPLGMKTLDPEDLQYRPTYDNSNDSSDPAIAKGLNYHNGPEWGWPLGYFLKAYLEFDKVNQDDTLHYLHRLLLEARGQIERDCWRGLPELANRNGGYCEDSCRTQAWSASTLLDFLACVHRRS